MKLRDDQMDVQTLGGFGEEAARLFLQRDFAGLAARFNYALSYGRDPAAAIEQDLARTLKEEPRKGYESKEPITVSYFKPNDTGLLALVEAVIVVSGNLKVLLELIVGTNEGKNLYLEDITHVA